MKKILILLMVLFLAYSIVLGVTTYSGANITADSATIKIASTGDALLALSPTDDPASLVTVSEGVLNLEFSFTPGQEQKFVFYKLFKIINNSTEDINFTVEGEDISYISVKPSDSGSYFILNGSNTGHYDHLLSGQFADIEVSISIPEGVNIGEMDGSLTVKAQAVP